MSTELPPAIAAANRLMGSLVRHLDASDDESGDTVTLHMRHGEESVDIVIDADGHLDHMAMSRGPGTTRVLGWEDDKS